MPNSHRHLHNRQRRADFLKEVEDFFDDINPFSDKSDSNRNEERDPDGKLLAVKSHECDMFSSNLRLYGR